MQKTIELFMWGYQHHFRINLKSRAEKVLHSVAPTLQPYVFLVGIRCPESDSGYTVCVEPEDGNWNPKLFFGCHTRAESIYENHPDHEIIYGDEPSMRDKPEKIRRKSVLEAVKEITSAYDVQHATVSFCGWPGRVAGYHVVPVLQFEKSQLDEYPRLPKAFQIQDWESPVSFLNSIIECLLADATLALSAKEPGRSINEVRTDVSATLRRAADRFCEAITLATGDILFQGIFDTLNVISSLLYEGEGIVGEMLCAAPTSNQVKTRIQFHEAIPLYQYRLARKVIEMSGDGLSCVCQGSEGIRGLGCTDGDADHVFRIVFTGHYKWDVYYGQVLLMKVEFGVPKLLMPLLDSEKFYSTVRRVFERVDTASEHRLWAMVEKSIEQQRGTILVISDHADEEARRLKGQAIGIEPTQLTPNDVRRLSGIDGAILVSADGICFAIGVILDGIATGYGDSSRGARFNSAIRYFTSSASAGRRTICVVISADGYVDMIPNLLPQIDRTEIERYVNALRTKNIQDLHKTIRWLDDHRFYLTPAQCEIVNNEISRIHSTPLEVGQFRIEYSKFVPHPGMNDSYYLPDR